MITKILNYMQKYHMLDEGGTIAAGVSGGADSVCLLFVLLQIREKIPFRLVVVHVNHGLRPEAGEDAAYVQRLCREQGLPFYLKEADVAAYAAEKKLSLEEAGRQIRYQTFQEVLAREGCPETGRIAVAHNSNDRAETMLFHLFRGTGLTGLCGILPVSGQIIRPLLCVERREIEAWLSARGIPYCTDSTNEEDHYTRNRIRHHILPFAEEQICHGATAHMNRTAEQLSEAEDFLKKVTREAFLRCRLPGEAAEICLSIPALQAQDPYLQGRLLLYCLEKLTAGRRDISAVHIEGIRCLSEGGGSGELHLPYGITVYREYETLRFCPGEERKPGDRKGTERGALPEYVILAGAFQQAFGDAWQAEKEFSSVEVPGLGRVEITAFLLKKSENIPQKTYTKWFDYDKITRSIVFRTRKAGDYLTINDRMDRKSLQDYFVNEKIPRAERDSFYVLAEESHVLWVPGHRISEYYKITPNTRRVLQVQIRR